MNKRHYEHTLPNIRGSLSNTYIEKSSIHNWLQNYYKFKIFIYLVSFFVFP